MAKQLMKGNEALAEGAVRAGCRFFAGYPITPQNEVPEYMSWRLPKAGGTFIQAESEVAAINMIYGAAATGTRCMTSSSSPGISLKQEGVSYCAGADLPFFFANVVRGGPGLGNIAGAQGDYFQAVKGGGHGDYRVFTMAPNGANEMANFPHKCYEIAFKYRVPSMILADGIIGQMMEPVEFERLEVDPAKLSVPDWTLGINRGRKRRVVNSYDLKEGALEKMINERVKRYRQIEENEVIYDERLLEDAETVLVAYGTSARVSMAAVKMAREKRMKVGLFRPVTLWPYPKKRLFQLADKVKNFLVVEMNLGQMVEDVVLSLNGKGKVYFYGRPGGTAITAEEVFSALENINKKGAKEYAAVK